MQRSRVSFSLLACSTLVTVLFATSCWEDVLVHGLPRDSVRQYGTLDTIYDDFSTPSTVKRVFGLTNTDPTVESFFWVEHAGGVDFSSVEGMLRSCGADTLSAFALAEALWELVSNSGFHQGYPTSANLEDRYHPLALARYPSFTCGEKAGILSNLACAAGLVARVVYLNGHVVTEIKYNGEWHMFDADERCYVVDDFGKVISVETLVDQTWRMSPKYVRSLDRSALLIVNFYRDGRLRVHSYGSEKSGECGKTDRLASLRLASNNGVLYRFKRTDLLTRFGRGARSRDFSGIGEITRKLDIDRPDVSQIDSTTFLLQDELPYYLKSVVIKVDGDSLEDFTFIGKRADTGMEVLRKLERTGSGSYGVHFDAPGGYEVFYRYAILVENCKAQALSAVTVNCTFDFNTLAIPLMQKGPKVIHIAARSAMTAPEVLFTVGN
jgi:hypothetical protein